MATRTIIEVVASYKDEASRGLESTSKSADKAKKKMEGAAGAAAKLGKTKAQVKIDAEDKATSKIKSVIDKAKSFASKTYKSSLAFTDKASNAINKVTGAARTFAGKTFSAAVKIKDYATAPLRNIKNALFNIKTLIAAITAGLAAKQFILNPINLADSYSSTKIGFSTLLGDEAGQKMMDEMDAFAKKTPFKTSGVISNAQKMMAYGWDPERILTDMETIGNAAAATGKMDQGLESIVYALSEIKSKGKLSTQELNQLASAGIKAKAYLAEGLGYGTSDEGMMRLAADLEKGAIGANQAIELILQGMKEFDGMMDKTANETVEGLKSQIEDAFEISIFRRWGQGLQDGAKRGLGSIVSLLDKSEDGLNKVGDMLYEIGKKASNWAADKLEKVVNTIMRVVDTEEFNNASLGGKIHILWDEVIAKPFSDWWDSTGREKFTKKAGEIGESLGSGISNGLLALLGVDVATGVEDGMSIGASFAKGFADGFDGSAVTGAIAKAIADVWDVLPWWAKVFIGGKALSGAGSVLSGANTALQTIGKIPSLIGSTGNAMMQGTGLLNILANAGYGLTGGAAGSTIAGGTAAAVGGAGILGGILGLMGIGSGVKSLVQGDYWGGGTKLGMVGTGAAAGAGIGTLIAGPAGTAVGALVGAGVGGLGAMLGGEKIGEWLSKLPEKMETFFTDTLPTKWNEFWDGVGNFFTETVPTAVGNAAEATGKFFTETIPEKWNEFWSGVGNFFTETVPYAIGYAAGATVRFFTETLPEKWDSFWNSVGTFFTETVPAWAESTWNGHIVPFFTVTIPTKWDELWNSISTFFTETIPTWAESVWNDKINPFFTVTVPGFFTSLWNSVSTFVTEGIPSIASTIWDNVSSFFTDTVPGWFSSVWDNLKGGFAAGLGGDDGKKTGKKRNAAGGIYGNYTLTSLAEEGPESVIPLGAKHRKRAISLFQQTADALGVGQSGVQFNMGGITIHVNGSNVQDVEKEAEEMAERVAAVFNRVLKAQFENMPAKAGV